jgi:hypothetical protein
MIVSSRDEGGLMAEDGAQPGGTKTQEAPLDPELRPIQVAEAKAKSDQAAAAARKASAEADKAEADAEAAAFATAFPKSTAAALEGKVEVAEKVGLVGDLVAHAMMRRAGEEIRNDIQRLLKKDETKILLVSSPDLVGDDWPYVAISEQIRQHKLELEQSRVMLSFVDELEADVEAGPGPVTEQVQAFELMDVVGAAGVAGKAVQVASSVAGGIAQLAALLRSDYKVAAREVSIGASPLLAGVAHFLVDKAKEVNVESFSLLDGSKLIQEFAATAELRTEVQRLVVGRKIWMEALQEEELGVLDEVADNRADIAVAEAAVKRFDAFAEDLLKAPAKGETGYPPLIAAAIRERLHDAERGYTHVLYAGVEAAGGESVTRRSFLRPSIRFIGGAQVTYLFYDVREQRLAAADTRPFLASAKMRLSSGFVGGAEAVSLR